MPSTQARRHFTRADQVNQLVEARAADPEMPESITEKKPAGPVIKERTLPTCADGDTMPKTVAEGKTQVVLANDGAVGTPVGMTSAAEGIRNVNRAFCNGCTSDF